MLDSDSKIELVRQIINFASAVHIYGIIKDGQSRVMFEQALMKSLFSQPSSLDCLKNTRYVVAIEK